MSIPGLNKKPPILKRLNVLPTSFRDFNKLFHHNVYEKYVNFMFTMANGDILKYVIINRTYNGPTSDAIKLKLFKIRHIGKAKNIMEVDTARFYEPIRIDHQSFNSTTYIIQFKGSHVNFKETNLDIFYI